MPVVSIDFGVSTRFGLSVVFFTITELIFLTFSQNSPHLKKISSFNENPESECKVSGVLKNSEDSQYYSR